MSLPVRRPPSAATVPARSDLLSSIRFHRDRAPDATACRLYVDGAWASLTRAEFWARIEHWSGIFAAELGEPTMVLFSKRLDVDLLAAYLGAMAAGHTPAQISYPSGKLSPAEFTRKVDHVRAICDVGAVFIDADNAAALREGGPRVFTPTTTSPGATPRFAPREDALVQFSSGSTGLQKGVHLTHTGVVAHMEAYAAHLDLRADDAVLSWLPLYHDMGLIAAYLMPLMTGIPFFQMDPFQWLLQSDRWLSAVEALGATIAYQPNFAYHVLARRVPQQRPDLSSVRMWVNCSEPARSESHELFMRTFPSVRPEAMQVCYALAENTFAVSHTRGDEVGRKQAGALSCGSLLPGSEVRILSPDASGHGEIGIRSAYRFDRFTGGRAWEDVDGFYPTGDLGFFGPSGDLYIAGRKKDVIICHGKNVYPQDVEFVAAEVDGAYPGRAVAFGLDNAMSGSEELYVVVERIAGADPTRLKLAVQRAVEGEIGVVPRRVEVAEHMTLVKTSSGKISRARNKELYRAQALEVIR